MLHIYCFIYDFGILCKRFVSVGTHRFYVLVNCMLIYFGAPSMHSLAGSDKLLGVFEHSLMPAL